MAEVSLLARIDFGVVAANLFVVFTAFLKFSRSNALEDLGESYKLSLSKEVKLRLHTTNKSNSNSRPQLQDAALD